MSRLYAFPVGLEEGPGGATLVHSFSVPGCVVGGASREEALGAFPGVLAQWLRFLAAHGEPTPPHGSELEVTVDEWVLSDADVATGESTACFESDLRPLAQAEIVQGVQRLGDLRGALLRRLRGIPDAELDRHAAGDWTVRRIADELARAQWWTLSRLGASPLAEVPGRTLSRLDTAMALVVQRLTELPPEARGRLMEIEGEDWTPRKVLRRLLWLEWSLGNAILNVEL